MDEHGTQSYCGQYHETEIEGTENKIKTSVTEAELK